MAARGVKRQYVTQSYARIRDGEPLETGQERDEHEEPRDGEAGGPQPHGVGELAIEAEEEGEHEWRDRDREWGCSRRENRKPRGVGLAHLEGRGTGGVLDPDRTGERLINSPP